MESKIKYRVIFLLFLFLGLVENDLKAQTLEQYLQIAAEKNPKVKASYAQFEAAMQQAPQVASLPDPTLTMSAFGKMIETRVGAQEAKFSLMQMFPWFGTLDAKRDAANLMAEAKFQQYLDVRNQVFFEVKSVYAEIYAIQKTIQLKQENLEILDSYRELSLSRFKSGNAPMSNIVKVDIKREGAITEIELLQELIEPMQTKLNLLLSQNSETPIETEDTLRFEIPEPLELKEELFDANPMLVVLDKQEEAFKMQEVVAGKNALPMIGLGVDYSIISKRTDANPEMNGQDAIMPMLSISLPIFQKKYRAAKKEAAIMSESVVHQKEAQKNELQTMYEMTLYEVKKAKKLISLYDRQLKSSDQANKLLISGFSNAIADFEEVLQMNQDILGLETQQVEALKDGFIASAKLDYLLANQSDVNISSTK
ncbi:Outer membrane protein TolC [Gillisia sp. Hel1_33_143]|uniref:TolC family protein n=1 Tax=Gillisia sp. Hel1_33_143 TaxID=1336796 RepID=UPI00087C0F12|nr:TolC family protein [Gillisia sp. Hel1_33_143]SDS02853.1 Outer membrane protein TolC [Gillisia sp. Hel1_33_143]